MCIMNIYMHPEGRPQIERQETAHTIEQIRQRLESVFVQYGVVRAMLFGSYARGEQSDASDIDIAIDEGQVRGLAFFRLQAELSDAPNKPVDLQSLNGSNLEFLNAILKDAVLIYSIERDSSPHSQQRTPNHALH